MKRTFLLLFFAFLVAFIFVSHTFNFGEDKDIIWGVTFSQKYAVELGLDWQEAYIAVLDDLQASHIRLAAYWDEIEPRNGVYDFSDLDWMLSEADNRGVDVVLAIGRRLPRWPECHTPRWLDNYSESGIQQEQLEMIEEVVTRYKNMSVISYWQVENEYFLGTFGICPPADHDFLDTEIELVRSLDATRDIIITDSGELSLWRHSAPRGDILGTTLYRIVWNESLGFFEYGFLAPAFYRFRADLAMKLNPALDTVISMEVQAEPWTFNKSMKAMSQIEREKTFTPDRFKDILYYTEQTGFSAGYLWGVEYWYWEKLMGNTIYWEIAKNLW